MKKKKTSKQKYWYKYTIIYCPMCGREYRYKDRMYSPKPKNVDERYSWHEVWDYCNVF